MADFVLEPVNLNVSLSQQQLALPLSDFGYAAQDYFLGDYAEENTIFNPSVAHNISVEMESSVKLLLDISDDNFFNIDLQPPTLTINLNNVGNQL